MPWRGRNWRLRFGGISFEFDGAAGTVSSSRMVIISSSSCSILFPPPPFVPNGCNHHWLYPWGGFFHSVLRLLGIERLLVEPRPSSGGSVGNRKSWRPGGIRSDDLHVPLWRDPVPGSAPFEGRLGRCKLSGSGSERPSVIAVSCTSR
jgi:hypothetical protein